MGYGLIPWPEFKPKYPKAAQSFAGALENYPFDKEWKAMMAVTPSQWTTIMTLAKEEDDSVGPKTQAFIDATLSNGILPPNEMDNGRIVANINIELAGMFYANVLHRPIVDAAPFITSAVHLVGNNGCEAARVILGFPKPDLALQFLQLIEGFCDLIENFNDYQLWTDVSRISKDQWIELLQTAHSEQPSEGTIGPKTNALILKMLEAMEFTADLAAAALMIAAMILLIIACIELFSLPSQVLIPGTMLIAVAFIVMSIILLVVSLGLELAIWFLGNKETQQGSINSTHVAELISTGLWTADPGVAGA